MGEHEFNKWAKSKELKPVSEIVVVPHRRRVRSPISGGLQRAKLAEITRNRAGM